VTLQLQHALAMLEFSNQFSQVLSNVAKLYCLFMSDKLIMLSHHVLGPCKDCVDHVWLTQC